MERYRKNNQGNCEKDEKAIRKERDMQLPLNMGTILRGK
jgi:hypothetical protein